MVATPHVESSCPNLYGLLEEMLPPCRLQRCKHHQHLWEHRKLLRLQWLQGGSLSWALLVWVFSYRQWGGFFTKGSMKVSTVVAHSDLLTFSSTCHFYSDLSFEGYWEKMTQLTAESTSWWLLHTRSIQHWTPGYDLSLDHDCKSY